ncbi:sugar ABC transporter substrate-binding protein [Priestia megaterium]|uniref:sugar ABC transporter substrate-binding protein n=1 Tax=Priestia megaterium TaxID=1404 RepID=UPI003A7FC53D
MKNKIWSFLTFSLILLLITGCSSGSTNASKKKDKQVFAVSFYTLNNPHWIEWSKGLKDTIEKHGDQLIITDGQDNLSKQVSDIEDLVTQQVDLIFVAPADSSGIKPALETAHSADIPVVVIDIPVKDKELVTSTVSTDNYLAGQLLAKEMIKETKGKANVGLIDYSVIDTAVQRSNGFFKVIKKKPGIKVIARQEGMASTELGMKVMENFLQSNPEINTVFASNDMTGLGASRAVEAAKRKDIKIFSVDGSKDALRAIKEGRLTGTAGQFPYKMGTVAAKTAFKIKNGEKVEKWIKVPPKWINKANVDEYLK